MNLKHVQLEKQDDEAFHLKDKTGSFKVLKKHVSKNLLDAIHQHFAEGGEVKEEKKEEPWSFAKALGGGSPSAPAEAPPDEPAGPPSLWDRMKEAYTTNPTGQFAAISPAPIMPPVPSMSEGPPPDAEVTPVAPGGFAPALSPMPSAQSAQAPGPGGSSGGGYNAEKQLQNAGNMAAQAEVDKAGLAQGKFGEQLKLQQDLETKKAATAKLWEDRYQQTQARGEQLAQDIASSKVDPGRFWSSKNLGQKVSASIGLILGGIGQAFGGGPNAALGIIQNQMEKDIEAQKADLGKKQGLLSHYVEQGHSIHEAKKLAMADMMDAYRGQVEMMDSKFGIPGASIAAKQAIAGITEKTAKDRMDAMLKSAQRGLAQAEADHYHAQAAAEQAKAKAGQGLVAPGYALGNVAIRPEEASQFRDALAAKTDISAAATELSQLVKKNGTAALPGEVKRRMDSLRSDMMLKIKDLNKLGAISDSDMKLMEAQVPDTTVWAPEWAAQTIPTLTQLSANLERKMASKANSMGLVSMQGQPLQGLITEGAK